MNCHSVSKVCQKSSSVSFSEFSSSTVSGSSAVVVADESKTRGGFTCGLSHNVPSITSKNVHFFSLLPALLLLELSFSCLYFCRNVFVLGTDRLLRPGGGGGGSEKCGV